MSTFIKAFQTASPTDTELDKRRRLSIDDETDFQYAKKRAGRKAIEEDSENSSDDPANKRKAQNRAAQKAFRERKQNQIRVLEKKIEVLQNKEEEKNLELQSENEKLKQIVEQLKNEKSLILGASIDLMQQQQQPPLQTDVFPHTFDVNNIQLNQHRSQIDKIMNGHYHYDDDTEMVAQANYTMKSGKCPTPESIVKAWNTVYEHPRFDEFDHNIICAEMKKLMTSVDIDPTEAIQRVTNEFYPVHDFLQ